MPEGVDIEVQLSNQDRPLARPEDDTSQAEVLKPAEDLIDRIKEGMKGPNPDPKAVLKDIADSKKDPQQINEELGTDDSVLPDEIQVDDSTQQEQVIVSPEVNTTNSVGKKIVEISGDEALIISLDDIAEYRLRAGLPRESELASLAPLDANEVNQALGELLDSKYEEFMGKEAIQRGEIQRDPEKVNPLKRKAISRVLKMRGIHQSEELLGVMEQEGIRIGKSLMNGEYVEALRQLEPAELQIGIQRVQSTGRYFDMSYLSADDTLATFKSIVTIPEDIFNGTLQDLDRYTFIRNRYAPLPVLVSMMQNGGLTSEQKRKLDAMQRLVLVSNVNDVYVINEEGKAARAYQGKGVQTVFDDALTVEEIELTVSIVGQLAYQTIKEGGEWNGCLGSDEDLNLLDIGRITELRKVREIIKGRVDGGSLRKLLMRNYKSPSAQEIADKVDSFYEFIKRPENIAWAELLESGKDTRMTGESEGIDVTKTDYYRDELKRFRDLRDMIGLLSQVVDDHSYDHLIKIDRHYSPPNYDYSPYPSPRMDAKAFELVASLLYYEMQDKSPDDSKTFLLAEIKNLLDLKRRGRFIPSIDVQFAEAEPLLLHLSRNKDRVGDFFKSQNEPTDSYANEVMNSEDIPARSKALFAKIHIDYLDPAYVIPNLNYLDSDTVIFYAEKLTDDVFDRLDLGQKDLTRLKLIKDATSPEFKLAIVSYDGEIDELYSNGIPTSKFAELAVLNNAYNFEQFGSVAFFESLNPQDRIFWENCTKLSQNFLKPILDLKSTVDLTSDEGRRKFDTIVTLLPVIADSPSQEIKRIGMELINVLWQSPDPQHSLQEIIEIFEKNNLPFVGKIYKVFETIYDSPSISGDTILEGDLTRRDNLSPTLKSADARTRREIIYRDLLSVHVKSANPQLRDYLEAIHSGEEVVSRLESDGIDALSDRDRVQLDHFLNKMDMLYASSLFGRTIENRKRARKIDSIPTRSGLDPAERVEALKRNFRVRSGQRLTDRLSDMFLRPVGFASIDEVLAEMEKSKEIADERNRELVQSSHGQIELKAGDRFKGVNSYIFGKILESGVVAREYLGAAADSDSTPYDTDTGIILEEDLTDGIEGAINASPSPGYGDILLVIRDRDQFGSNPGQYESFASGVIGKRDFGIRTGFPSSEIDAVINNVEMESRRLDDLFVTIAQHGQYIPVASRDGTIILTPEKYDEYRKIFDGVSEYSADPVTIKRVGIDESSYSFPESLQVVATTRAALDELQPDIIADREIVEGLSSQIRQRVGEALVSNGVTLRGEFDTSIYGAEIVDTGSTSRGTNLPKDYDFDMSLQLDPNDSSRMAEVAEVVKNALRLQEDESHAESDYIQVRAMGSQIIEGHALDIDIGIGKRADGGIFASSEAVGQKLESIRVTSGDEAYYDVLANIVLTKKVLRAGGAYKKLEDGGLGGIGVENWILLNNGNMLDAFQSFWQAAHEGDRVLSHDEFVERYKIFDAGINIKFNNHDNFARVLKPNGYEAMIRTIGEYLGYS